MVDPGQLLAQAEVPGGDAAAGSDDPVQRALARVGATLRHKWRLDSLLGIGGMAAVYAATHRNGSRAAVKVLHPELSIDPFLRQRFLHEGYVANSVGHDGAVKVIDDDSSEDGSLFLVTELLEGETLEERRFRMMEGRLPQDEVLLLADQLLDVLAAAHDHGIVHRDVKPENVFLTTAGQVKVLDFGIARLRPASPAENVATATGTTMGTPAFMAPEHARGRRDEVDELSDVWSCGALMFRLLSGCMVHEGDTLNEQLLSAMTKPAPRLAAVAPDVSPAVAQLVDRALASRKDKRWPGARAMQEAVRQVYEELHGAPLVAAARLTVREVVPGLSPAATLAVPSSKFDTAIRVVESLRSGAGRVWSGRTWRAVIFLGAATTAIGAILYLAFAANRPSASAQPAQSVAAPVVIHPAAAELDALKGAEALSQPGHAVATPLPRTAPPPVAAPPPMATPLAAAAPPPLVAPPPVAMPPAVAPQTVVLAPVRARPAPPAASRAPPPPAPRSSAPPPVRSGCTPPYVVDAASGKKQWKIECL